MMKLDEFVDVFQYTSAPQWPLTITVPKFKRNWFQKHHIPVRMLTKEDFDKVMGSENPVKLLLRDNVYELCHGFVLVYGGHEVMIIRNPDNVHGFFLYHETEDTLEYIKTDILSKHVYITFLYLLTYYPA